MPFEHRYDESDWREFENARDLARLAEEERDTAELIIETVPRSTGGVLVKAGEYLSKAGHCDSSGYFESYIDVDQTSAVLCPGCPACEETRKDWAAIPEEFAPEAIPPQIERKPISFPRERVAKIGNGLFVRKRRA